MKRTLHAFISTCAVSVLAVSALARDPIIPKTERADYTWGAVAQTPRADRLNGVSKASDLIGMTVNNYQDQRLGTVEDGESPHR